MATKKKTTLKEDDASAMNASSVANKPVPSKLDMMTNTISAMASMDQNEMQEFFAKVMASIGHEADGIPDDAAAKNAASVQMKGAIAEDVAAIFGDSKELSEEFKNKATTLFETAVTARLILKEETIREEMQLEYNEKLSEAVELIEAKADRYFTAIGEQWLEDNKIAVSDALVVEAARSFFDDLSALYEKHNIVVPEGKVDLIEEIASRNESLEETVNELMVSNIELTKELSEVVKAELVKLVSEGLAETEKIKFVKLTEDIEFDPDTFEDKLKIIKEQYFDKKKSSSKVLAESMTNSFEITEGLGDEFSETEDKLYDPSMLKYISAINNLGKNDPRK